MREGVSGRPETAPEWSQLVDRTVLAGQELTRLALDDPMRHHVPFSPAVVGRCEKKLLPWEAVDASVEAAWWLDDHRVAAATDPEEEALDGSGDGLKPGELGMWSVQQAAWLSRATLEGHTGLRAGHRHLVARAQEVARAIPQSRYLELPDVGHLTPVTHPRRVVGPVLRFFAEIDGFAGPSMP